MIIQMASHLLFFLSLDSKLTLGEEIKWWLDELFKMDGKRNLQGSGNILASQKHLWFLKISQKITVCFLNPHLLLAQSLESCSVLKVKFY